MLSPKKYFTLRLNLCTLKKNNYPTRKKVLQNQIKNAKIYIIYNCGGHMEQLKDCFFDLISNNVIWVPILTWMIAQVAKMIVNLCMEKKFDIERLFGDGGMPSAHSATVSALMAMCGWAYGFNSAYFAIATMFAVVVVHDATGVRREAGKHATSILQIVESLNGLMDEDEHIRTEKLKELVGHTPLQAFFGVLLGWCVVLVYCILSKNGYMFALV